MQKVSTTSSSVRSSAKTLVVFPKNFQEKIMPVLNNWLSSPAEIIGDKIYAVLNIPKGKVNFQGMTECDIIGA